MPRLLLIAFSLLLSACMSAPPTSNFRPLPTAVRPQLNSVEILLGNHPELTLSSANYAQLPLKRTAQFASVPVQLLAAGNSKPHYGATNADVYVFGFFLSASIVAAGLGLIVGTGEASYQALDHFITQRASAPISQNAASIDAYTQFSQAIRQASADHPDATWLGASKITLVAPPNPANYDVWHSFSDAPATLMVDLRYSMPTDLNTLILHGEVRLIPRSDAMWQLQYQHFRSGQRTDKLPGQFVTDARHALYQRHIEIHLALPEAQSTRRAASQAWTENDNKVLRRALQTGLNQLSKTLVSELHNPQQVAEQTEVLTIHSPLTTP